MIIIKVIGKMIKDMVMGIIFGMIKMNIKEIGRIIKEMDMVINYFRKGLYLWHNGNTFDGNWVNDKRNGYGTKVWINGDKY